MEKSDLEGKRARMRELAQQVETLRACPPPQPVSLWDAGLGLRRNVRLVLLSLLGAWLLLRVAIPFLYGLGISGIAFFAVKLVVFALYTAATVLGLAALFGVAACPEKYREMVSCRRQNAEIAQRSRRDAERLRAAEQELAMLTDEVDAASHGSPGQNG